MGMKLRGVESNTRLLHHEMKASRHIKLGLGLGNIPGHRIVMDVVALADRAFILGWQTSLSPLSSHGSDALTSSIWRGISEYVSIADAKVCIEANQSIQANTSVA